MRSKVLLCVCVVLTMSSSCFAVYSFSDNFDDGIIDSSFWDVGGDGVSESGGVLSITRNNADDGLSSKTSFSGLFDITFNMRLANIDWPDMFHGISLQESKGTSHPDGVSFGFSKYGHFYSALSDSSTTEWDYSGSFQTEVTYAFRLTNDTDHVYLYVNNSLLFTQYFGHIDSFYVNFPGLYDYGGSGSSTRSSIDNFSIIPEPATMLLLTLGGLVLRKKR